MDWTQSLQRQLTEHVQGQVMCSTASQVQADDAEDGRLRADNDLHDGLRAAGSGPSSSSTTTTRRYSHHELGGSQAHC